MVIDHINAVWFEYTIYPLLLIGRGAFPLFCYAVAAAVLKKESAGGGNNYIIKLLLLAVLVQPVYQMMPWPVTANVLFTLAAGAAFAALAARIKLWMIYLLCTLASLSALLPPALEFGLSGVMLPSAFLLAMRGEKSAYPFLFLLLLSINMNGLMEALQQESASELWHGALMLGFASILLPMIVLSVARDFPQNRRYLPKYALHIFYPAHLVIIRLLGLFI